MRSHHRHIPELNVGSRSDWITRGILYYVVRILASFTAITSERHTTNARVVKKTDLVHHVWIIIIINATLFRFNLWFHDIDSLTMKTVRTPSMFFQKIICKQRHAEYTIRSHLRSIIYYYYLCQNELKMWNVLPFRGSENCWNVKWPHLVGGQNTKKYNNEKCTQNEFSLSPSRSTFLLKIKFFVFAVEIVDHLVYASACHSDHNSWIKLKM